MKKIIVLVLMIQSCLFYGQQQGDEKPKPVKFSSSDRAGVLYYEAEEVADNIKVKMDTDRFYDMAKALRKYNGKVKEIAFLNSKNFKELDIFINNALNKQGEAPVETDPAVLKKKQEETEHLRNIIPSVHKEIRGFEKVLNEKLETILKEKQFKKWLKYQKRKRRSLLPERPQRSSDNRTTRSSNSGFGRGLNSQQRGIR